VARLDLIRRSQLAKTTKIFRECLVAIAMSRNQHCVDALQNSWCPNDVERLLDPRAAGFRCEHDLPLGAVRVERSRHCAPHQFVRLSPDDLAHATPAEHTLLIPPAEPRPGSRARRPAEPHHASAFVTPLADASDIADDLPDRIGVSVNPHLDVPLLLDSPGRSCGRAPAGRRVTSIRRCESVNEDEAPHRWNQAHHCPPVVRAHIIDQPVPSTSAIAAARRT
jgi:hypothetical protein